MNLLNVQASSTSSKPSLISSLWSIQVQMQNEAVDPSIDMMPAKGLNLSQQSLPELQRATCADYPAVPEQPPMKSSRSLSDLHNVQQQGMADARISEAEAATMANYPIPAMKSAVESVDDRQWVPVSRHQKNQEICQWLQRLDINQPATTSTFSPDFSISAAVAMARGEEDVAMSDQQSA